MANHDLICYGILLLLLILLIIVLNHFELIFTEDED